MKKIVNKISLFSFLTIASWLMSITTIYAQNLSLEQVIQNVIDHYPSFKTAAMQVERAQLETEKVQSQLGWQLGAQGGVARNLSFFGTPTDVYDLGANLSRKLKDGETVSIQGSLSHEDAESAFSAATANPVTKSTIDLNYRQPLQKGNNNPAYKQGLASAEAGVVITQAEQEKLYDQMATRIMDLYFSASITQVRLRNAEMAIKRSRRLYQYNKDRTSLGISEDKDLLQVKAQLHSKQAEHRGLLMAWQQQQTALNRLMGRPWDAEIKTSLKSLFTRPKKDFQSLFHEVKTYSPALKSIAGRLQLAESVIASSYDSSKDQLDLVLFIGGRNSQGDATTGSVDDSDVVGGVRMEYSQAIDKRGVDAAVYQAKLDRDIALRDKQQIEEDLQYDLASLLAEFKAGEAALKAYDSSVNSEHKKLNEANQRYRTGRSETDQLILFESQLSVAELLLDLQRIELARRYSRISLLTGNIWKSVKFPEYQFTDNYSFEKRK